jgi:trans-L-3-hydroxyproline dehydratase
MTRRVDYDPPAEWPRVETVEMHTGGEPLRVVVDGLPEVPGETMVEKRRYARDHLETYRRALMLEPRGHADMYGAFLVDPPTDDGDLGVLFTHTDGYSTMCGHGVVALGRLAVEAGVVDGSTVRMDTPAGRVTARVDDDDPPRVTFENVPSFVLERDLAVDVPGYGAVTVDVAFGGAFYAYCEAAALGVDLGGDVRDLVDAGRALERAVADAVDVEHPAEPDLGFLYGVVLTGDPRGDADSRNACVFADGEVDRCPTGTGVSGRVALRRDDGALARGAPFAVESVVGSTFVGRWTDAVDYEGYDAVVPEVSGTAHVVGRSEFVLDPADPFREGFALR